MKEIQGEGDNIPLNPTERKMYESEYKHGADLFQRALNEHAKSDNIYQREEFKEVMEKAMQVLNETASALKKKDLEQQNQQIEQDYESYRNTGSLEAKDRLNRDLEKAKHSRP
ncbi:MAG: hypothetical protein KGJ02_05750 [Verrucomicrobiota bacterium]|nr:hypothetical protein [Verrucomicrobiota bacterium]